MHATCPPALPIPDCTTFAGVGPFLMKTMDRWEAGEIEPSPFFFFAVCDPPPWKHLAPRTSSVPERLLCVVMDNPGRQVMFSALAAIEQREGMKPRLKFLNISLHPHTPLKRIYEQMAAAPVTVFSVTPQDLVGPSFFFIRGSPTTTALREEFPNHILDPDAKFEMSNFRIGIPPVVQN